MKFLSAFLESLYHGKPFCPKDSGLVVTEPLIGERFTDRHLANENAWQAHCQTPAKRRNN